MKEEEETYKSNENEYFSYLGKNVRILLANNFTYTGKVIDVNEKSLTIFDKFSQRVTFHLNSIAIISEVQK